MKAYMIRDKVTGEFWTRGDFYNYDRTCYLTFSKRSAKAYLNNRIAPNCVPEGYDPKTYINPYRNFEVVEVELNLPLE